MKKRTTWGGFLFSFLSFFSPFPAVQAVPSVMLDARLISDLRLLANGSFEPLTEFMGEKDYHSVLENMRLSNGQLFPLPIVLPVEETAALESLLEGKLLLKDETNTPLAFCHVTEVYDPDLEKESLCSLGTQDPLHPFVPILSQRAGKKYVAGSIEILPSLLILDKQEEVLSPENMRALLKQNGNRPVLAFQTRNPLHGTHMALINYALKLAGPDAQLLLHPVIGPTQEEDVPAHVRRKCYQAVLDQFHPHSVTLSYLPLSMRMAGPREALLHALIRKNYGATHFVVGKDQAGPSTKKENGEPFYSPLAAAELVKKYEKELGLQILAIPQPFFFIEELGQFLPEEAVEPGMTIGRVSGSALRKKLQNGEAIPSWFSKPEVLSILKKHYERRNGLCIYLTGLSGAGKTTLARALKKKIEEIDPLLREVILLDGDEVRKHLSALGFSKKDRSQNIQRIGYVASLIVASGGIVICANIAPYEEDRQINRRLISPKGGYFEVFVDTPLEVCEKRDLKGLYKLAREGKLPEFVGICSPYEIPIRPDLVVCGTEDLELNCEKILRKNFENFFSQ